VTASSIGFDHNHTTGLVNVRPRASVDAIPRSVVGGVDASGNGCVALLGRVPLPHRRLCKGSAVVSLTSHPRLEGVPR